MNKKIRKSICKIAESGTKYWLLDSKLHREDGPAVIYHNGIEYWFLNNVEYTEEDFWKELFKRGFISEKELFLKLL
jgi:hypothetical protein